MHFRQAKLLVLFKKRNEDQKEKRIKNQNTRN